MGCVRTCLILFVILTFVDFHQCGRYGGSRGSSRGSSSSSRGSYHSTSYSRPSAPVYHSRPSPSVYRPRPSPPPRHNPSPRPNPPAYEPPARVATSRPVQNQYRPTSRPHSTSRPHYPAGSTSRPHYPAGPTSRTHYPAAPTSRTHYPAGPTSRPRYPAGTTARPRYPTARPSVGWNHLPPRPGHGPVGPPRHGYTTGHTQNIKIENKYHYHYPGYYSLPVAHYGYPGYYFAPSYYHYGVHDTGSTALGFYLGYSLARLSTPTYSHYSFYDGYRPRYDHYSVHHYYHNRDAVPATQQIQPNTIVGCVGDSATICPENTKSLCTSSGSLMCVVDSKSTVPCADNRDLKCISSTISCVNNTAPECKNSNKNTTISIPCVSKAEVYGNITYVNNTIIIINQNGTNSTSSNSTITTNGTTTNGTTTEETYSTKYPITTTPVPVPPTNVTASRKKREVAQDFCVTIVAVPAKRKSTEGEEFLNDAKFIAGKFVENVFDL